MARHRQSLTAATAHGRGELLEIWPVLCGLRSCLTEYVTCDAAVGVLKEIKVELRAVQLRGPASPRRADTPP